ncbi:MAG: phenylalanine--tRNA ligase subunit beta [Bacilli bacterium]|nr:phenylalanine--tRNA ligase subunit beta [Bacilli bacterium]
MRVKLEWLNELVDIEGLSVEEIVEKINLYSTEVEGIERILSGTNLVIGHVVQRKDHPDSDHLSICQVNIGSEVTQIVCGAPNVKEGQFVIVALVGAVLPGDVKIKKSKIRGVESNGMICSLQELGMEKKYIPEEYQEGIYYFTHQVNPGDNPLKELNFADEIIDLSITPNRGDLMSMIGVAFEVSAIFNRPLKKRFFDVIEKGAKTTDVVKVSIDSNLCNLYYAKAYKNVKIKKSPNWLTSRLIAFGVRPINNVVDITNYILALFGQPIHAFDSDKLGNEIKVRLATKNEKIVTLDNIERNLQESDLVITDGVTPVAIAGVMGGLATEVTNDTKNIILEVAVFDPQTIRATSLKLGLRSEASIRFERGVDANKAIEVIRYASYLMSELADAEVLVGVAVAGKENIEDTIIKIHENDINKVLGTTITREEVIEVLQRLHFHVNCEDSIYVSVPNRRSDVKIKADLIEEIGRIYGYDKLKITLPRSSLKGGRTNYQKKRMKLRNALVGLGLDEIYTYTLVTETKNKEFAYNHYQGSKEITIINPINNEKKYLRRGIIPSMLEVASYNYARKMKDLALFEIGKVYYDLETNQEEEVLAIVMANNFSDTLWDGKNEFVDFYVVKGIIDATFASLGIEFEYRPLDKEIQQMHPKRTATILANGTIIGFVGELHPKYAKDNSLEDIYVAEIKVEKLLNINKETPVFSQITKVPSVERDIAIVIAKDVLAADIINVIKKADRKGLEQVKIFDLYIGDKIGNDEKSIAIKMKFTSFEALTDEVINGKVNKIMKELTKEFNARLRA